MREWANNEINGCYEFELQKDKDLGSDENFLIAEKSESDDVLYGDVVLGND